MLILFCSVACLHFNGRFYETFLQYQSKVVIPDAYFSYDIEDNEEDDGNSKESLGLGDFTVYNLMILFIMRPI